MLCLERLDLRLIIAGQLADLVTNFDVDFCKPVHWNYFICHVVFLRLMVHCTVLDNACKHYLNLFLSSFHFTFVLGLL